jgi:FlaA1/EpsC-like NDP-sugar epimerase
MAIASTADHTETMDEVRALQRALAVDFKTPSENQTDQLQGKTLLVTGGASGFGRQS